MSRNYVTEMDALIGDMHADLGLSRRLLWQVMADLCIARLRAIDTKDDNDKEAI